MLFRSINLFKVEKEHFDWLSKLESVLYYVIVCLSLFGIIAYKGELQEAMKTTKINLYDILITNEACNLKSNKTLLHYFIEGLKW